MSTPLDPTQQEPQTSDAAPQYAPAQPAAPQQPAPQYAAPEVRTPQYAAPQYQSTPATNTMAIIALVASFFVSIVGVILGHISLSQIKKTGESGRGLAIAALIIGYIGIAVWIIVVIVWIAILAAIGMSSSY